MFVFFREDFLTIVQQFLPYGESDSIRFQIVYPIFQTIDQVFLEKPKSLPFILALLCPFSCLNSCCFKHEFF